jgi:thymidylate kinase
MAQTNKVIEDLVAILPICKRWVMTTQNNSSDSRRGRCPKELSFLKAHREVYLQLGQVDEDNAFVIIDPDNQLQETKNNEERFLFLEESRSQEVYSNETRADYNEDTFKDKTNTKYVSWGMEEY